MRRKRDGRKREQTRSIKRKGKDKGSKEKRKRRREKKKMTNKVATTGKKKNAER